MAATPNALNVRPADLAGPDAIEVSRLVKAYLLQTEREKAHHLRGEAPESDLPARYAGEVEDPAHAYAHATAHLAELGGLAVGVVVLQQLGDVVELKRVWVDPRARGQGAGAALLDTAIADGDLPVRLSVWDWREAAIRLYRGCGFVTVPTWDDRPRLICMERRSQAAVG